jgi:SAM-dependent methyltransferase
MENRREYHLEKFSVFEAVLDPEREYEFLDQPRGFPIKFAGAGFTKEDYVAESANSGFPPFIDEVMGNPGKRYLDIGCGFRDRVCENCLYLEVYPSFTADVIVPPDSAYPIKSESVDGIGCFAVLEHVTRPWEVAAEIRRMLRPGGKIFIDWPFLQPVHGFPSHYFNATRHGLELMFSEGFELHFCRTEPFQTPDHTISWILGKFVRDLPPEKRHILEAMKIGELIGHPPNGEFWKGILSGLPDRTISEFACGNTLVATKSM